MTTTHAAETTSQTWSPDLVELYANNFDKLVGIATGIVRDRGLAEEVVQDAFVAYHVKGAQPAPNREPAYLRSMVRNGAISKLRSEARFIDAEPEPWQQRKEPSAEVVALAAISAEQVTTKLSCLPSRQLEVVDLRLAGLSVLESADAMSISTGSVKTHRHRAAAAMRTILGDPVAA